MSNESNRSTKILALVWMALAVTIRVLPHPPNMNAALGVSLFAGRELGWKAGVVASVVMLAISDVLLSLIHGHAIFGWWSLFTYSGLLVLVAAGKFWGKSFSAPRAIGLSLSSTIFFWVWTNFGTWLTSGMYSLDLAGLLACYGLAIPFLGLALVGDLSFMLLIFLSFDFAKQHYFSKAHLSA